MFGGAACAEASIGDRDACDTPIVVLQRAANQPAKRVADVHICLAKAILLEGRGNRPTWVENFCPSAA